MVRSFPISENEYKKARTDTYRSSYTKVVPTGDMFNNP